MSSEGVRKASGYDIHDVARKKTKSEKKIIKGTVILMKKIAFDFMAKVVVQGVTLQLVSAGNDNPENILEAKIGTPEKCNEKSLFKNITFPVTFDWNEDFGTPGAILVRNSKDHFFLKTVTLTDVPGHGQIHFICNSYVYREEFYRPNVRVFFSNKTYLPHQMPVALRKYKEEELRILRGNGEGELKEWDRVYDYALYNDLGDPDNDKKFARPILGGSDKLPYPRRGRTGRTPSKSDPNTESRQIIRFGKFKIYVPRDEKFSPLKKSEFEENDHHGVVHGIFDKFSALYLKPEFDCFEEVDNLYNETGLFGKHPFPSPQVIKGDTDRNKPPTSWRTDEEFAREMVAGQNPILIRLLQEFPPASKLDPELYGHQHSSITEQDIENYLEGHTVEEARNRNRLFILDHHDTVIPHLWKINKDTSTETYASRTLLFLKDDHTLKPVAIELSFPYEKGHNKFGVVRKVYTPAEKGVEGCIWQLAKAYVAVVDTGHHQLISHWLNTHAVIEPFVIATNRQLSVVHPIYKLLHPHFRDTMTINALAREILVNANGLVEKTFYPQKYSMEMSSEIYKSWNFLEQALPKDLKKRGIAVDDKNSLHGLRLLIKDYPYAVDGLKIWFAIENWVRDYCFFYYKTDKMVQEDPELQAWWKELREVGHGDKKHEPWWPKMQTREELIESCTIIIWIASALHAAVNFGQYAYGGYSPNRPTLSRRFMPEKGTREYAELEKNPEKAFPKAFFRRIASKIQCLVGISLVEVLSKHTSDEVYLGQRDPDWTTDEKPVEYHKAFQVRLAEIEKEIISMNEDNTLKNRVGPVKVPYTLLFPTGEVGLSGKGIPNSISI